MADPLADLPLSTPADIHEAMVELHEELKLAGGELSQAQNAYVSQRRQLLVAMMGSAERRQQVSEAQELMRRLDDLERQRDATGCDTIPPMASTTLRGDAE